MWGSKGYWSVWFCSYCWCCWFRFYRFFHFLCFSISTFAKILRSFDLENTASFIGCCPFSKGLHLTGTGCVVILLVKHCNEISFIHWDVLYRFIKWWNSIRNLFLTLKLNWRYQLCWLFSFHVNTLTYYTLGLYWHEFQTIL